MSSKEHKNKHKLEDPYEESDLQGKLTRYLKDYPFDHVAEVKLVSGGSLSFSRFEDQQLPSLSKASSDGLIRKLTDASIGCKPYDYDCSVGRKAYVVCQFWKNIQQEICYFLSIDKVLKIKKSGAKSLKESDFIKYGHSINLADYKKGIKK